MWCTALTENYKAAYGLWQKRYPSFRKNTVENFLLNQENYILKEEKIRDIEIDDIKENIRSNFQYNIKDHITEEKPTKVWTLAKNTETTNSEEMQDSAQPEISQRQNCK